MAVSEEIISEIWRDLFIDNIGCGIFDDDCSTNDDCDKDINLGVISSFSVELNQDKIVNIELESHKSSSRDLVGLQLWRGAFLLAEYLCHSNNIVKNQNVLELAAGTGFTSLVAALTAKKVICTDVDRGSILSLIQSNFERNSAALQANYMVDEIDFFTTDWEPKLKSDLKDVNLILCADVVYNADITRAFFRTLNNLLKLTKEDVTIIISLEKRLWTNLDGEIIAPSYQIFLDCLQEFKESNTNALVEEIEVTFPHIFSQYYDRVNSLVMWKIKN